MAGGWGGSSDNPSFERVCSVLAAQVAGLVRSKGDVFLGYLTADGAGCPTD